MTNYTEFTPPPTCPDGRVCIHEGECMAKYLLKRELTTPLPGQQDAIKALMRRAVCTDPGFLETLWEAFTFLIHNPRKY